MKKLYLARHAQKEKDIDGVDDFDRQLSSKGLKDAELMANFFNSKNPKIDMILASPAQRTKTTAEIFAKKLNYKKNIMYNEGLYLPYVNDLFEIITYTLDDVDNLLVVGHNPSFTALAHILSKLNKKILMGGIVEIDFNCDSWLDICKENSKLISYNEPDSL